MQNQQVLEEMLQDTMDVWHVGVLYSVWVESFMTFIPACTF